MNYLIKLYPNYTSPTAAGLIYSRGLLDLIKTAINKIEEYDVVAGAAFDKSTNLTTIGKTVSGSCFYRQGSLYLSIKLTDPKFLYILNDDSYKAFPSIKIEASKSDVFQANADKTVTIHAAGPVHLKDILFCRDGDSRNFTE